MFLFNSSKPDIDSLLFTTFGWNLDENNKYYRVWRNDQNTAGLYLNFFEKDPELPTMKDINVLRLFFRNLLVPSNGGIIEIAFEEKNNIKILKTIFKISRGPSQGIDFLGSLIIPFRDFSYVLKVQAGETGTTGYREAIVLSECMANGAIQTENGKLLNWFFDPYDSTINNGVMMCKADLLEYDDRFPEHPLTVVRQKIQQSVDSLEFKKQIYKLKPFEK